jgi:hypothetical protein
MIVIQHRNVNQAYGHGMSLLQTQGVVEQSRGGNVVVLPEPLCNVYLRPTERVLFSPARDANPFFHLAEAMWMLAGRKDGAFLDTYISDFSQRYAEPDGNIHGAYGHRWRAHFDEHDQLSSLICILQKDPSTRQAVLTMWDPVTDLDAQVRDKPCNTSVYFRVHQNTGALDMTVLCRSNDAVWGCYGANHVHFSILQEFVASACGFRMGSYRQVSHNFHVYKWWLDQHGPVEELHSHGQDHDLYTHREPHNSSLDRPPLVAATPLFGDIRENWREVLRDIEAHCRDPLILSSQTNAPVLYTAQMYAHAYRAYRAKDRQDALLCLQHIKHRDWRLAGEQWMYRRWARARERALGEIGL